MARRVLTRRERLLIIAASVIFFSMIILPAARILSRRYEDTHRELGAASHRLQEARDLRRTILEQRKGAELIAKRVSRGKGEFELYTFVGSTIDQLGLKGNASFKSLVAPARLNLVSIDLNSISLDDLIKLMHTLQSGEHLVALENLNNIEVVKDNKGLNCSITLSAPRA